jgi:hypothetical protein
MALIRDAPEVARLSLLRNPTCALSWSVADLIPVCGHYDTNRRRTLLDTCLLFNDPHGHPSYWLHPKASQDLVAT